MSAYVCSRGRRKSPMPPRSAVSGLITAHTRSAPRQSLTKYDIYRNSLRHNADLSQIDQIEMNQQAEYAPESRNQLQIILQLLVIIAISVGVTQMVVIPLFQDKVMSPVQRWEVEYLAGGTIELLAAELNSIAAEVRPGRVDELRRQFGFTISIVELERLDLNQQSEKRLREHAAVGDPTTGSAYRMLEGDDRVLVFDQTLVPARHLVTEAQRRHMGTFAMLERALGSQLPQNWKAVIDSASTSFDYPVALMLISTLDLTADQRAELVEGRIVTIETEDSVTADYPAEMAYKKLATSDKVLVLGPFSGPTLKRFYPVISVYYVVVSLIILLPLGLWLTPTLRSMNRLSKATIAIGRGDFEVRGARVRFSKVNYLTDGFNQMASKIQGLIESNKALINAVSHELRTPISRIEFNIELARQSSDIVERDKQLGRIEDSVDELKTLVAEMLQYARFDREKPSFSMVSVNINEWLYSERENWQNGDMDTSIEVVVPEDPVYASLERYYMSRAISNLVRNATKFAQSKIRVSAQLTNGMCVIAVEDDGPGVDYHERTRIFEPFVRNDRSRNRDSGGTGLGLAIVKQIMAWHAGDVWVEDSPLGGAKFVMRWPQTEATATQ